MGIMGCCWNNRFNKWVMLNIAVLLCHATHFWEQGCSKQFVLEMMRTSRMVLIFLLILSAGSLDYLSKSIVYDGDDSTEVVQIAPEFVWSEDGQWRYFRPAFQFTGKCDICMRSVKWHCFAIHQINYSFWASAYHHHRCIIISIMSPRQEIIIVITTSTNIICDHNYSHHQYTTVTIIIISLCQEIFLFLHNKSFTS